MWPLPFRVDTQLYIVVLGALLLGLVVGAVMAWLAGLGVRRRAWSGSRHSARLERDLAAAEKARDDARAVPAAEGAALAKRRRAAAEDD